MRAWLAMFALWPFAVLGQISVEDAWARATPSGAKLAAGYLTVVNAGEADRLLGASSAAAARVELHVNLKEGEVFRMREVREFGLPARGRLEFKPAGAHLMFVDIRQPFRLGDKVPVTLKFERAGDLRVELHVGKPSPALGGRRH